jgi:anti-anti-sigma regulatory factor
MEFKIDTKEKMHVITVEDKNLTATMTEELRNTLLPYLQMSVKNVVINFENVNEIDNSAAEEFYDARFSMVFCKFQPSVEEFLEKNEFLEEMNVTPTESEAWDIVQMEEIERDLF